MAKKAKKTSEKKVIKKLEKKKINKYNIYLGTFVLIIILMIIIYYSSFIQISKELEGYQENQIPMITTPSQIVVGGFCKRDSECFITTCKDSQIKDCVNTTQLTDYNKNCKTYSDWIVEKQDPSKCACIQNSCKMV